MPNESEQHVSQMGIDTFEDLLVARKKVRELMEINKFSTLDQTKFVTAISELLRNVLIHAGNGKIKFSLIDKSTKVGLTCYISDDGPGIQDIPRAMTDGYSTVGSLGLGLNGAKKLSDEFFIASTMNVGTNIQITKWR